jgi:hypothetical protein
MKLASLVQNIPSDSNSIEIERWELGAFEPTLWQFRLQQFEETARRVDGYEEYKPAAASRPRGRFESYIRNFGSLVSSRQAAAAANKREGDTLHSYETRLPGWRLPRTHASCAELMRYGRTSAVQ